MEVGNFPKAENKWLSHWELNPVTNERIMCRSENFIDYHEAYKNLSCNYLDKIVSQLFNETGVLFKEKINHKLPGGAGFSV